jgi:hypothetical protein
MSDGWQRIVTGRVSAVVRLLRDRGVLVYWVGLPRMRDPGFDADIQAMNRFYAAQMAALEVPYIETLPLSVDAGGHYAPYLPAEPGSTGERRMARANDGVHMTITGYIHLTRGLTDRIRGSVAQDRFRRPRRPPIRRTADARPPRRLRRHVLRSGAARAGLRQAGGRHARAHHPDRRQP